MCTYGVWLYRGIFEKEGKNKQTIQVPCFTPPTHPPSVPGGMRWRSLSANQNRLNWGQRTNSPLIPSFQSPASLDLFFFWLATELSGIRFGKIGWEGHCYAPIRGIGFPLTPVRSSQVHPSSIVPAGKTCDNAERGFSRPRLLCAEIYYARRQGHWL